MTTSGNSNPQRDAQQQIIDRATRDPAFRSRLLENPKMAIEEELGRSIFSSATIRVIEEQPGEVILVLPARPIEPGTNLSDEDLERVAGGATVATVECSTCAAGCPH
jgi:hypothetical protein